MTEKKIKRWLGNQTKCDLCHIPFSDIEWFADAFCRTLRQWALVCPECHAENTSGRFGTGVGQKYDAATKIKVEG
jgi:hypothetical protein